MELSVGTIVHAPEHRCGHSMYTEWNTKSLRRGGVVRGRRTASHKRLRLVWIQ